MSQSLSKMYIHIIFSTKNREPVIAQEIQIELYSILGTVLNKLQCPPIQIGGYHDHVHVLSILSRNHAVREIVQKVKSISSSWIKKKGREYQNFHWQGGYGAFSVSQSQLEKLIYYIQTQEEHHKVHSFN